MTAGAAASAAIGSGASDDVVGPRVAGQVVGRLELLHERLDHLHFVSFSPYTDMPKQSASVSLVGIPDWRPNSPHENLPGGGRGLPLMFP
ncbi:hypothetical protein [Actinacidiphila sp. bgisy167]|uniref:hypothetical protein n=1 Tax=Actinacidiphila sp. bgisy167 TaxID=3413797 RepID=UPI003D75AD3C